MPRSSATWEGSSKGKNLLKIALRSLLQQNWRYLRKKAYRPVLKGLCIRCICFYQKYLSRGMCLYKPTCSEYTKRCINNLGVVRGILLGAWRILRCNPLSRGWIDPAPEKYSKKKWLL
ncbi:MAG TPA: membrane protein insertion efficiency factor YidD [Candidatus Gallimonas intestinigallinarum]|uniref:Membrane protein insertion efficiency factor YidD n=1 Tax=Candidatus Gallimonas intestinigallinarum TaxID=2838604 RepID=A0A9D2DXM3_9FIRM|nr:membrane protein insertion efficiency factor YidD [Candidatus Gallimonas intestinigallinarum]